MVLSFDRYYSRTSALDCPAIFYVVHNILIRKDMVRKSQFLSDLNLTVCLLIETIEHIKSLGLQAGISLHPQTPVSAIMPYLDKVDKVLIMTVNTGFGGQKYIEGCTQKIVAIRKAIQDRGLSVDVEVDGGVNKENAEKIIEAREYTVRELEKLGFSILPSKANFVFAKADFI